MTLPWTWFLILGRGLQDHKFLCRHSWRTLDKVTATMFQEQASDKSDTYWKGKKLNLTMFGKVVRFDDFSYLVQEVSIIVSVVNWKIEQWFIRQSIKQKIGKNEAYITILYLSFLKKEHQTRCDFVVIICNSRLSYLVCQISYEELLDQAKLQSLHLGRLRSLATEIHKTVHGGAPPYVSSLFTERESEYSLRRNHSLILPQYNTISFGK